MAKTTILLTGDLQNAVFDATKSQVIKFTYSGNQVVGNRLVIRDNMSDAIVYDNFTESMRLEHILPTDSLENGRVYNAVIYATYRLSDGTQVEDEPSDTVILSCFLTPVVAFENLSAGQTVSNSSYDLLVHYEQPQGDLPNWYIVRLYDTTQQEIWNSGFLYPAATSSSFTASATISNLINAQGYFVSADFESVGGMSGSTGKVAFVVDYIRPLSYSTLYVDNMPRQYSVRVRSNIKIINGIIDGPDPEYTDGELINLSDGETTVSWVEQGTISGDFQLMLRVMSGDEIGKEILELSNDTGRVTVTILRGLLYGQTSEKMYAVLEYRIDGVDSDFFVTTSEPHPLLPPGSFYVVSVVHEGPHYNISLILEG